MYFITTALANHNVVPLVWNIYLREISTRGNERPSLVVR